MDSQTHNQNESTAWPAQSASEPERFSPGLVPQMLDGLGGDEPVGKAPIRLRLLVILGICALASVVGLAINSFLAEKATVPVKVKKRPTFVLRAEPASFPAGSFMPDVSEGNASGSIDMGTFSAGRDLVYVDDRRVWWESENDKDDEEDDHSMHQSVEAPLRRLINLVDKEGGVLRIQDAYRGSGIHSGRSLHKEGRALDLTCEELGLERLAKLCWRAGFDWVLFESGTKGGDHVHASVRRAPKPSQEIAQRVE